MVHDVHQRLTFGLLLFGLTALWIVTELRQRQGLARLVLSALAGAFAIPATYFTFIAVEVEGGWSELLRTLTRHPATLIALGIIVALALIEIGGWQRRLPIPSLAGTTALAVIPVVLVIGASALVNPNAVTGAAARSRSDLIDTARWAHANTAQDAIFLLPFHDFGFGWRLYSERASAGKPANGCTTPSSTRVIRPSSPRERGVPSWSESMSTIGCATIPICEQARSS